jgi:hypothetical protein
MSIDRVLSLFNEAILSRLLNARLNLILERIDLVLRMRKVDLEVQGGTGEFSCSEVISRLGYYLKKELSLFERKAIQKHLFGCPSCQQELDNQAELQQQIRSWLYLKAGRVTPDPYLRIKLLARVREQKK